jgi:putative hydrolase of the HAD superfamily
MSKRFIDQFDVVLLDMGNTFMFNVDRFGEGEDYYATYRALGGKMLTPDEVSAYISDVFNRMLEAARDSARMDDYGDVRRFLLESGADADLSPSELDLIMEVFSSHEVGSIPPGHADAIRKLRRSHPLGLVSNVGSPSPIFESALEKAGIRDLFTVRVWSSDYLSIKPSQKLFQVALDAFSVDPSRIVYVGDNPKRDIAGVKAMGMAAVWIRNEMRPLTPEIPEPDCIVSDLTQLTEISI